MPLRFTCPSCGQTTDRISQRFLGKRVQCGCGQVVRLGPKLEPPAEQPEEPPSPQATAPAHRREERSETVAPAGLGTQAKAGLQKFAPPPETVERMFGKSPPSPGRRHYETPPLNPVSGRPDPFRDGVATDAPTEAPRNPMLFPPLDVPVTVTPVVVALPYEYANWNPRLTAYLGLFGGVLGTLQGIGLSLLAVYLLLKLSALRQSLGGDQLGLSAELRETIRGQLVVDLSLLGILLVMNLVLAVACGIQMIAGVFEVGREMNSARQSAVNSALTCGLYLVLIAALGVGYYATGSGRIPGPLSRETLFGPFTGVIVGLAGLGLIPLLLVTLGALRARE